MTFISTKLLLIKCSGLKDGKNGYIEFVTETEIPHPQCPYTGTVCWLQCPNNAVTAEKQNWIL